MFRRAIRSVAGGDAAVVAASGPAVWRAIVRVLGAAGDDAADCFQQAFAELAGQHGHVDRPEALLKCIAVARAIDCVRRRVRERGRRGDIEVEAVAADTPLVDRAEGDELRADLRDALADLPEPQASAFVLTQIEDLSHEEAAAAIGVTANHVGVLLHRARATLRERLESHRPVREARS